MLDIIETKECVDMRWYCDFTVRDANKLLFGLILFELCLVLIFAADTLLGSPSWIIKELIDLDEEHNIPAWFSSVQLFLIALVFLLKSCQLYPDHSPLRSFFLMVSTGFIFLSADEVASIHEKITWVFKHVEFMPRFKGDHGIWIFVYALIGLILFLAAFRTLAAMWKRYRQATLIMAIGMGMALIGGVVMEVISYQFLRSGSTPLLYKAEVAIEEFLEMSGVSVTLYGAILLLLYEELKGGGRGSNYMPNNTMNADRIKPVIANVILKEDKEY